MAGLVDMPAVSAAVVSEADLVAHIQVVSPDTAWLSTAAAGEAAVEAGDAEGGDRAYCMLVAVLTLIAIPTIPTPPATADTLTSW